MQPAERSLAVIHILSYQGEKLSKSWADLVEHFRILLRQSAVEQKGSSPVLLIFSYPHPHIAISNITECLEKIKTDFSWKETGSPLPMQFIFHLMDKEDTTTNIFDINSDIWNLLKPEGFYVTRNLKYHWEEMMAGRKLPPHSFVTEDGGLSMLHLSEGTSIRSAKLFPFRDMALRGKHPFCFYCGMTKHLAKDCPSKFLPPVTNALQHAGYLVFSEFSAAYRKALLNSSKLHEIYGKGVNPTSIRSNRELLAYTAYFDAFRIYQPRFLFKMAFGFHLRWMIHDNNEKMKVDNRNLNVGLDCMRVGKYSHAEELLGKEASRLGGKQFYFTVALALLAIEKGRQQDTTTYLDRARALASSEKEQIYSALLQARFFMLQGDYYKAKEVASGAVKLKYDCYEARYLLREIEAQQQFNEKTLQQLQSLIEEDRDLFMTALVDPHLMPVHGFVEELQSAQVLKIREQAASSFKEARLTYNTLAAWLQAEDDRLRQKGEEVDILEKKLNRGSYFDLLDVVARSHSLVLACRRLMTQVTHDLEESIEKERKRLGQLHSFWRSYFYKAFFGAFNETLGNTAALLTGAEEQLALKDSVSFKEAVRMHGEAKDAVDQLKNRLERMLWIQSLLDGIKSFGKKLLLSEVVMLALALALLYGGQSFFSDGSGSIVKLLKAPQAFSRVFYLTALLLAPTIAMLLTIWSLRDK